MANCAYLFLDEGGNFDFSPTGILHHASRSHYGLQIADYCNWAVFRKWQKGEVEFYDLIKPALKSEFDIFRTGTTLYY
ncbi:MAG: hypothetical protein A3H93_02840 [Rhodocyclales bacterium RIFCSPLOWO2_02_FULL_63_24]|nr:MAG: hypothetical protein A3H93_02840 [Rhodocyclales bacterium RIFCSPLOWO2_02_FULL_63_24]